MMESTLLILLGVVTGGLLGLLADAAVHTRGMHDTASSIPRWMLPVGTALGTAAIWGLLQSYVFVPGGDSDVPLLVVGAILMATVGADLKGRIIPNELVILGGGAGLVLLPASNTPLPFLGTAAGIGLGLGLLRTLSRKLTGHPGVGMGDVKLLMVLGLCLGPATLWAAYLGVVLSAVAGGIGRLLGHAGPRAHLPFAPFLAAGCLLHWTCLPVHTVLSLFS